LDTFSALKSANGYVHFNKNFTLLTKTKKNAFKLQQRNFPATRKTKFYNKHQTKNYTKTILQIAKITNVQLWT